MIWASTIIKIIFWKTLHKTKSYVKYLHLGWDCTKRLLKKRGILGKMFSSLILSLTLKLYLLVHFYFFCTLLLLIPYIYVYIISLLNFIHPLRLVFNQFGQPGYTWILNSLSFVLLLHEESIIKCPLNKDMVGYGVSYVPDLQNASPPW